MNILSHLLRQLAQNNYQGHHFSPDTETARLKNDNVIFYHRETYRHSRKQETTAGGGISFSQANNVVQKVYR